jgi:hypothetical protein
MQVRFHLATVPPVMGFIPRTVSTTTLCLFTACLGTVGETPFRTSEEPANQPPIGPDAQPLDPDFVPMASIARRLNHEEFFYTLEDLFAVPISEADRSLVPVDRPVQGFINGAQGQALLSDHIFAYHNIAKSVVARMDIARFVARYSECQDETFSCAETFVRAAGRRLFRRPVTSSELDAFSGLFDAALRSGLDFESGAAGTLRAMLQAPPFLYLMGVEHIEGETGLRQRSGYAIATKLSYLIWSSTPDETLLDAAEQGSLDTPAGILAQADRMMQDTARLGRSTRRFLVDWAGLDSLPDPDGNSLDLIDSAVAYFQDIFNDANRGMMDMFVSSDVFLTPKLAEVFDLQTDGLSMGPYDLSESEGRAGILTQPGIVAGMTNADGGEIVARGLFLQRQIFCDIPPSPPASLDTIIEDFLKELPEGASERLIAETRLERPSCGGCHMGFDPLAYGFERYDYRGTHRTTDDHGNTLDTTGWIPGRYTGSGEDQAYSTPAELGALLRDNADAESCLLEKTLQFALNDALGPEQKAQIPGLQARIRSSDDTWMSVIRSTITHDLFRLQALQ